MPQTRKSPDPVTGTPGGLLVQVKQAHGVPENEHARVRSFALHDVRQAQMRAHSAAVAASWAAFHVAVPQGFASYVYRYRDGGGVLRADPKVTAVVVEHRDRLRRMNSELAESALSAHGRRLVVLDDGEVADDLMRDMVEVLTCTAAGPRGIGR